ncbi:NADH-quinone oxidoreductase subunit NuoG [Pseudemcibacter aquimaris]|uniref:NADH-quinone oxidoreductase subunit NuoG n=1 Tax=Pseudemcibacter aquimaris TaxID=2857064 RepID=UPI0020122442|nr:NADH-quinone oxidoreductase subunit NuoG [Pseudemcibacter aquimaris]MCC3860861.1 NADH-quinone oxidoreductase subunit NuoG [Pseudemcibacter aquimaris]WDU59679.1 NADH-quinone oxidoreductase subunit NuoG [Pseudemcibacter aquimaris]
MPTLTIDGIEVEVDNGTTVLQAAEQAGVEIPRFCYHERLSIAGNCRMCLVEVTPGPPKPAASCALPAGDGMEVKTNTEKVRKFREGVMEFLLINHPLDCPICDQGGECDLQDQSVAYGVGDSRYLEKRRIVKEKYMGPLIRTIMTRCIHCTRCVRFADEIAGVPSLGAIGRGENMQITTYQEQAFASEMAGNVVDLCPVGALTSKPYTFKARPWELKNTETIDVHDALGSNVRIDSRGSAVMRALPRIHEDVNEEWISDKTRHAVDGLAKNRLDRPYVKVDGKLQEATWAEAFEAIAAKVNGLKSGEIAGLVGDLNDAESMYAMKSLIASLGGEVESRQDGSKLGAKHRAGYLFNSGVSGIDEADAILIVGSNTRLESPVLNARIRQRWLTRDCKIANVGPAVDLTYKIDQLGDSASVLGDILDGKNDFAKVLKDAKKPMIILGAGALNRDDSLAIIKAAHDIADKYGMISDDWNGFNVLHTAASRVAALDMGLVTEGGIEGVLNGAEKGDIKVVYNMGADELDTSRLANAFVIYQGSHGDEGVKNADVILPGVAYTEKPGTYLNTEGRVQVAQRAIFGPGEAREDWTIFRALSEALGKTLPYDNIIQLRKAMVADYPAFAAVDQKPTAQWADIGVKGDLSAYGFTLPITDFYGTNPIARSSETMAECRSALSGGEYVEGATGT